MAAPDIVLGGGQILVYQSGSVLGFEVQTNGYIFATIDLVNDSTDGSVVGQVVLFKQSDGIQLKYGSTIYFIVEEKKVVGKENPAP